MSRLLVIVLTLAASACTFDDGTGFATLESASLSARFEPGAREAGTNTVLTDLAYQVSLSKFVLRVERLRLEERLDAPVNGSLDPEQSFETVAELPIEQEIDLLADPLLPLDRVEPSRELPHTTLARAALALSALSIAGTAAGGTLSAPLSFELEVSALGSLSQGLDFGVDRDAPEALALSAELTTDGKLFDGIDFASLAGARPLRLSDPNDAAVIAVAQEVLASSFSVVLAGK